MLDDKLREIVFQASYHGDVLEDTVAQIIQAFADDRKIHPDDKQIVRLFLDGKLMTGQEWYDRFEKELQKTYDGLNKARRIPNPDNVQEAMIKAAKKASGL